MLARIHSAATLGLDARVLDVEVDASHGLPRFTIVGLPDADGPRGARARPLGAAATAAFRSPPERHRQPGARRTFASAAPRSTCPWRSACSWLCGVRPRRRPRARLRRRARPGRPGARRSAERSASRWPPGTPGSRRSSLPAANAAEAAAVEGIRVIPVAHLTAAVRHLARRRPRSRPQARAAPRAGLDPAADFADVRGQADRAPRRRDRGRRRTPPAPDGAARRRQDHARAPAAGDPAAAVARRSRSTSPASTRSPA